ncbi:MAG: CHASE3 domain-containing protein, partial [Brevundimonas sp.]
MKWIDDMTVGRKLAAGFGTVLAAIAVMGAVVIMNLMALDQAGAKRGLESQISLKTSEAEFYMARQENSFRGYLVTGDGYYLERLAAHRENFKKRLEGLRGDLPADRQEPVNEAEKAADEWHKQVVEQAGVLIASGRGSEALLLARRDGVSDTFIGPVEEQLELLEADGAAQLQAATTAQEAASRTATIALIVGLIAALAAAVGAGWVATRAIVG